MDPANILHVYVVICIILAERCGGLLYSKAGKDQRKLPANRLVVRGADVQQADAEERRAFS